jgi:hypothetical protein
VAKRIGAELPEDAYSALRPGDLEAKRNCVVQIITINPQGWPDAGLLSYADILAKDRSTLCLATWEDGECASDLKHNGKIAVLLIDRDMTYYVKGTAEEQKLQGPPLADINQEGGESGLAFFKIHIEEVFEDKVPTARVLSGVTFEGSDIEEKAHREIFLRLLAS